MSELLTALVAASKVGFEAPKCVRCTRLAVMGAEPREPAPFVCNYCHDTGLDASDPFGLIGRAEEWLLKREHYPAIHTYPLSLRFVNYTEAGDMLELDQAHDKTSEGRTTALLRLVARVGGKQ